MRSYTITTDLVTKQVTTRTPATYKQYDANQILNVEVFENGQPYSLTACTVLAYLKMPNKPIEQRTCIINGNTATINLDSYLLSVAGTVQFEIEIRKSGTITTTARLRYVVEPSFDDNGAIVTAPHWDLVSRLLDLNLEDYLTKEQFEQIIADAEAGVPVNLADYVKDEDLANIALTGDYADLINTPTLSPVATSGDYNDLTNKPTIPTIPATYNAEDIVFDDGESLQEKFDEDELGGGQVASGSSFGVIKSGDALLTANQGNDVLEVEGVGIDVQLIRGNGQDVFDRLKLLKTDTTFSQIIGKPFSSLSSDFIVDDKGVVSIDRNKVGGSAGGGMPFINIMDFKVWEVNPAYPATSTEPYIEVKYSALGDNFKSGTIDTKAIERAFRLAKDNGSVNIYIPDGRFILNQTIQLYPNTNVQMSRNAVIRKNHDDPMFSNSQPNEWFLGYGGRGKIYWQGGTLDSKDNTGTLDANGTPKGKARAGSTFSLVNAEYFEFKNIIFLDQKNTHHFDLSGIRNIVMSECYFYGYTYDTKNPDGTNIPLDKVRAYSECIQIDYSSHQAMPSQNTGHDGTACQFVFVQKCKFDKSDMYPSWNRAVGMHNVYFPTYNWICNTNGTLTGNNFNFEYSKAKNVYITDNEIYGNGTIIHDYFTTDATTGEKIYDPQSYIIQQVRLLNVDNVYVSGNKFENVKGGISFDADQSSKTMIDTDAQRDFSTSNSGHLMPYSVEWTDHRGDKQKILYSESTSDKGTKVTTYTQYGKTYTITWAKSAKVLDYYGISNCHVINNTFKNVTAGVYDANGVPTYQPSTPIYVRGECRTKASATLQGTRANKVIIMGNIIDGVEVVPCEAQSRIASAKGVTNIAPAGTTGSQYWTPNIVSAISATYTRNLTVIGNEIRNCSRAVYTSGCNRGLIANNQIFTVKETEAICIVGGGIYLVTGNILDNLWDSAIRMKGTDQFFVEGNVITNANKGTTWQIDVPFFQYNPRDKATIWVEVDGSGGSNFGSVSNNKIYSSFTSNYIKHPIYIGSENSYVKSAGNFFFGTYQYNRNTDLNFSDCGEDTAFRGNDAETLNGKNYDDLKASFLEKTVYDSHATNNGIHVTSQEKTNWNNHLINTISHVTQADKDYWNGKASTAQLQSILDSVEAMSTSLTNHLSNSDVHISNTERSALNNVTTHFSNTAIHVTNSEKTSWNNHVVNTGIHVTSNEKDAWNGKANAIDVNNSISELDERLDVLETQKPSIDNHLSREEGKEGLASHFDNLAQKTMVLNHIDLDTVDVDGEPLHFSEGQKRALEDHLDTSVVGEIGEKSHFIGTEKATWKEHMSREVGTEGATSHVTQADKDNWNGKANATDVATMETALDGRLDDVEAHAVNGDVHVTTEDKTNWNAKSDKTYVDDNFFVKTGTTKQDISPEVKFQKNTQFQRYEEKLGTATNGSCDLSTGSIFNIPVNANITITFNSLVAETGYVQSIVLYIIMNGTYTLTFPASVKWHNSSLPTLANGKTHEIVLRTTDGGISWFATLGGSF